MAPAYPHATGVAVYPALFLIALISEQFKLQMPNGSPIKYDLKMFISETKLVPVTKLFEN